MKYLEALELSNCRPQLIPMFKQTERKLLSVFMSLLAISPQIRGAFLKRCGFNSGASCQFSAAMEVSFQSSQIADVRPDGLIACQKGKTRWAAFIEAKSDKNSIRADQITSYLELARQTGVESIITISNEFARIPCEPPYHVDGKKSRSLNVLHFAWSDIRTNLELARCNLDLFEAEDALLRECLEYFWHEKSGILTYDAMPEVWPNFVEAASTALGFNSNVKGFTDVVYGWQQERRDLCSKLTHLLGDEVELRHRAGVRSTEEERSRMDRQDLANNYILHTQYFFRRARLAIGVELNLHSSRMIATMGVPVPEGKGARASITWLTKLLTDMPLTGANLFIDWPGRGHDIELAVPDFLREPDIVLDGQKAAPKAVSLILSRHGVRNFKSRKKVIVDLEEMVLSMARYGIDAGWL